MSMPAAKTAHKRWVPKEEAAIMLGISRRQIERREQQGYLEKRIEPRQPNERTARVSYALDDIQALKAGKPNVHARIVPDGESMPAVPETGTASIALAPIPPHRAPQGGRSAEPFLAEIAAQLARIAVPAPLAAPALKAWIPLADAADYSGLPASFLRAKALSGVPWAENVGTEKRPRFRFNREMLKGAL